MAKPGPAPQLRLSEARDQFVRWHEGERHAIATIEKQRSVINSFIDSIGKDILLNSVEQHHVTTWRTARGMSKTGRRGELLSKGTLNNDRVILGTFFKWCRDNKHYRGRLPTEGLRRTKGFDKEHLHLPREEWPAFLDACETPRDRWHAAVAFYTGARSQEIAWLTMASIKPHERSGKPGIEIVRWKSYKHDHMVMVDEFREEYDRWLAVYRKQLQGQGIELLQEHRLVPSFQYGSGGVVQGKNGQFQRTWKLVPTRSPAKPEAFVHKVLAKLGYADTLGEGMHMFRRSSALAFLKELNYRVDVLREVLEDTPIRIVMHFLDHDDQRTTERYLGLGAGKHGRDAVMSGPMFRSREPEPVAPVVQMEEAPVRHLSIVRNVG